MLKRPVGPGGLTDQGAFAYTGTMGDAWVVGVLAGAVDSTRQKCVHLQSAATDDLGPSWVWLSTFPVDLKCAYMVVWTKVDLCSTCLYDGSRRDRSSGAIFGRATPLYN